MKWKKLGKIFEPKNNFPWMVSHATCPVIVNKKNDIFLIYFSSRDNYNRSYTNALEYNMRKFKIINIFNKPFLCPGKIGNFDEDGSMLTCIISTEKKEFLYYIGWNKAISIPFRNSIGLAYKMKSIVKKNYEGPIIDRSIYDPCFVASCWVLKSGNKYDMWYTSCIKWVKTNNGLKHYYHIKHAFSSDGINWEKDGKICIDFLSKYEYAISRPCVIKDNNLYKMWYSFRGQKNIDTYRIGYAESQDGLHWIRKDDEVGIDVSKEGWDSEMICYPCIFDYNGNRYMLYNGNSYGKTGFGLAVLEQD